MIKPLGFIPQPLARKNKKIRSRAGHGSSTDGNSINRDGTMNIVDEESDQGTKAARGHASLSKPGKFKLENR